MFQKKEINPPKPNQKPSPVAATAVSAFKAQERNPPIGIFHRARFRNLFPCFKSESNPATSAQGAFIDNISGEKEMKGISSKDGCNKLFMAIKFTLMDKGGKR